MGMKRKTNRRSWKAELLIISQKIDSEDRPITSFEKQRVIYYAALGVTSNEKFVSMQEKNEVVKRIDIAIDRSITEKTHRIKILDVVYRIVRIYLDEDNKGMELSLAYVD